MKRIIEDLKQEHFTVTDWILGAIFSIVIALLSGLG